MRKSILALALLASTVALPSVTIADVQDRHTTSLGTVSFTAASQAPIFFRPNGSKAIPATYTATSLVPQSVYVEKFTLAGLNATTAMTVTLVSTDVTYTAGTNERHLFTWIVPAATDNNTPRSVDFTNYGTSKGILAPKWPALVVDSGTNTPIAVIQWSPAPKNKTQP